MTDWRELTESIMDLEMRQNDVLVRLNELNDRVEGTLRTWLNGAPTVETATEV